MLGCRGKVVTLVLVLAGATAWAQSTDAAPDDADRERVAKLVRELGSAEYAAREAAAKQLAELTPELRALLQAHVDDKDLEVRLRVRQILARTRRDDFEQKLALFLSNSRSAQDLELLGWDRFRAVLGDSVPVRKLFVDVIRYEADLIECLERTPAELTKQLDARAQFLQALNNVPGAAGVHPASVAALLYVGTEANSSSGLLSSRLYVLLHHSANKQSIMGGAHRPLLLQLLERWVVMRAESAPDDFSLQLALSYELHDTSLNVGRKLLDASETNRNIQHAAIAVGRFGNRQDDFARLQRHVHNKAVCHTWSNAQLKKDGVIEIQIRDVVLVMLLHLTDQDPKQYGFDLLQPNPSTMYHIYTFGFIEAEQREAAHAKWEAWCKAEGLVAE